MINPKFSILMCARNAGKTIANAIDSVLSQSYKNYELVILDNGSCDNTLQILTNYCNSNPQLFKIVHLDNGIGWAHGTSECLKISSGDYMIFLAADDFLSSNYSLEIVAKNIKDYDSDIVWVGNGYAQYDDLSCKFITKSTTTPSNHLMLGKDRIDDIFRIMYETYYNSMFHFEKIEFLRKCDIDFYKPYYADCESMTELMYRANNMVMISDNIYTLTINTSQTRGAVSEKYLGKNQWDSINKALIEKGEYQKEKYEYIAFRILNNVFNNLYLLCLETTQVRDDDMNDLQFSDHDKLFKIIEIINDDSFKEMDFLSRNTPLNNRDKFVIEFNNICQRLNYNSHDYYNPSFSADNIYSEIIILLNRALQIKNMFPNREDYILIINDCLDLYDIINTELSVSQNQSVLNILKLLT